MRTLACIALVLANASTARADDNSLQAPAPQRTFGVDGGYATVDTGFGQASDSDSEVGFTPTAGVRRGALDLRAGLFAPDTDDVHGFMASLGYDFASF